MDITTIEATRYLDFDAEIKTIYCATNADDGWIYFNDSLFFRYNAQKDILQAFDEEKRIWNETSRLIIDDSTKNRLGRIDSLDERTGSSVPDFLPNANDDVEKYCETAEYCLENRYFEYSYDNRSLNWYSTVNDCSSFVLMCLDHSGFDVNGATYTYNMDLLTYVGWTYIPVSQLTDLNDLQRGDILLTFGAPSGAGGHTAIYLGQEDGKGYTADCGHTDAPALRRDYIYSPFTFLGVTTDGILRYTG